VTRKRERKCLNMACLHEVSDANEGKPVANRARRVSGFMLGSPWLMGRPVAGAAGLGCCYMFSVDQGFR